MPSRLDFDSTKRFRDFMIGKTLNVPNGPQEFNSTTYSVQDTSAIGNQDLGDVDDNRNQDLSIPQSKNTYKPDNYFILEDLAVLPRRANLNLYPDFRTNQYHNIIGIMTTDNLEYESELMKFAGYWMQSDYGPIHSRISQNLYSATTGRVRLIDALEGNTATAINIVTGREPLIELNNKITVAKTLPGKTIDFIQTVAGVEFPWAEIPGDYLSNPDHTITNRPPSATEGAALFQDITGALGQLIGIQRRPKLERKPSDLFIEYMGEGSRQRLYDNLSFSKYAPNYTTTARSQNSSKVFNFIDKVSSSVKEFLKLEAPKGVAYIGDDRGNDVYYAMNDFNDRPVKSNYYLSFLFDEIQTRLFQKDTNITEGGSVSGNLTWISSKSQNKYNQNSSQFSDSLSTKFTFRDGSLLSKTQEILETMPVNGGEARSHVGNVIDQTSRIFKEGDIMLSRGSAVKYVDKYNGTEAGMEYCRVWTKDSPYMSNDVLMKNGRLLRKFESSVLSTPYNLNIYPNSDGNNSFPENSTNMKKGQGDGFFAKKYMFSIENLAWKSSNTPGFTYNDLPYCERGNNGGRVMWFPPYDLKVQEQNQADWNENKFLGRPEPIYTYQSTTRSGTISFKVIVDHPSILNLLVKKHFNGMSDYEADNYINAFFSGCEDLDFYDLITEYTTLDQNDVKMITAYLESSKDQVTAYKLKVDYEEPVDDSNIPETSSPTNDPKIKNTKTNEIKSVLFYENDYPKMASTTTPQYSNKPFDELAKQYTDNSGNYQSILDDGIDQLIQDATNKTNLPNVKNDTKLLFGKEITDPVDIESFRSHIKEKLTGHFEYAVVSFATFDDQITSLKDKLENNLIKEILISISSATSNLAETSYNLDLSYRRSHSIILYVLNQLKKDKLPDFKWVSGEQPPIKFSDLGYADNDGQITFTNVTNFGEDLLYSFDDGNVFDCNCGMYSLNELSVAAPLPFICRQSSVTLNYIEFTDEKTETNPKVEIPKRNLIPEQVVINKKPPLDELKRIIMKTLSECYYFKQMELETPTVFSSLKEKLKYFHPAFHSMTPEGLNARLTFLQQCIRPGDTLPIKGVSDDNDLNARNTTFGPPPICVLRVGDFYHSKVVIRDININFDDSLWDLNPEGIGIQPMIADVTMQVNFIGGHGLEKPVERLQNALSSNFYANTEMYDYRATATENRDKFNKEFLEQMVKPYLSPPVPDTNTNTANKISEGNFIGVVDGNNLVYNDLVKTLFDLNKEYFTNYYNGLNQIINTYGNKFSSVYFHSDYRSVYKYTVQTGGLHQILNLLGEYPKFKDLDYYLNGFKLLILNKVNDTSYDLSQLIGFNNVLNETGVATSNEIMRPWLNEKMGDYIDDMYNVSGVDKIVDTRNKLTSTLDKLNFIVSSSYDGKPSSNNETIAAVLSGFTPTTFYSKYDTCIDYIIINHSRLTSNINNSYDFTNVLTINDADFSEFLSIFLKVNINPLLDNFMKSDLTYYDENRILKMRRILATFTDTSLLYKKTLPSLNIIGKYPEIKDSNPIQFSFTEESGIFDSNQIIDLNKINSSSVELGDKLNFYKP